MSIRYINVALFMICSLIFLYSRNIRIEIDITLSTVDLQKNKFTNLYQMDQRWWELYNRKCGEGLTDVKREGADIEKV